ncbi:(2Fe-2S)-binding protein [Actinocorallia sp. API 0066]
MTSSRRRNVHRLFHRVPPGVEKCGDCPL